MPLEYCQICIKFKISIMIWSNSSNINTPLISENGLELGTSKSKMKTGRVNYQANSKSINQRKLHILNNSTTMPTDVLILFPESKMQDQISNLKSTIFLYFCFLLVAYLSKNKLFKIINKWEIMFGTRRKEKNDMATCLISSVAVLLMQSRVNPL